MENNNSSDTTRKQVDSPSSPSSRSSSFADDLLGSKDSASTTPSTGIFSSIFPHPSKVMGRSGSTSELLECIERNSARSQVWDKRTPEVLAKNNEDAGHYQSNKGRRSIFQERAEPCPLSSSLYYGGQEDMYVRSSSTQTEGSYPAFKKPGEEDDQNDDSSYASRGNWWQGSLYY